jgi:FMN phosphatase YigB (HAD superfamily)
MIKDIIFDFYKTLYNPEDKSLYRGITTLLKKLSKRYKLILVSTGEVNRRKKIQKLGIDKYFKEVIVCEQKTFNDYAKIISSPTRTLIIGDCIEEEIKIGKKIKCNTLLINSKKENPTKTIKRYLQKIP